MAMPRHRVIALITVAIGLAGCNGAGGRRAAPPLAETPKSIQVVRTDEPHRVSVDPATGRPTVTERARIAALVAARQQPTATYVIVRGPQSRSKLEPLVQVLVAAGIAYDRIALRPGEPLTPAGQAGDVELDFARYAVAVPPCPDWSHTYGLGNMNDVSSNLGCADATNLAAMIDDPRDILAGRGSNWTDAETAGRAVARYGAGEVKLPTSEGAAPTPFPISGAPAPGATP